MTSHSYMRGDTIAAIATPPGEGGIAVIRLSGSEAVSISQKMFTGSVEGYASHTVHFGKMINSQEAVIDEGLLLIMRAPRSYTGEDVVELQCHGGTLIAKKVLEAALKAGARAASPGEFTYRAFLNGKIDLLQAEAVQQLIAAKNELALSSAEKQLQGQLSKKVKGFQTDLLDVAAILEAWVDFPEEGLEFASLEEIVQKVEEVREKIVKLHETFETGKMVHEGFSLCLAGVPNVGKSSLMNALLGKDRSIVTPLAGTTRDVIEDDLRLGRLHFKILDTAGIRETEEMIEQEGVKRSQEAMAEADIVLLVLDLSQELSEEERKLIHASSQGRTILVGNKVDIADRDFSGLEHFPSIKVSAASGLYIDKLQDLIESLVMKSAVSSKEEVLITSARHKDALQKASLALFKLSTGLQTKISPEFLTAEMRYALSELSSVMGMDITEDILTAIFSKFCVGK